jgi:threonine/homoserine/homoserine lactone efflux protein
VGDAVGGLLPIAAAVALSPIPIVAIVLILGTPRARGNGPAFAVGWVVGLCAVSAVVLVVLRGAADPDSGPGVAASWLTLGLGIGLVVAAARQWRKRPPDGEDPPTPAWMASLDSIEPPRAAGLGLALSALNPKNLALTVSAAALIAEAGLDRTDTLIAVALFVAIGSATVVGAVVASIAGGERAVGPLASLKSFMLAHNAAIMAVVCLLLGAKLIGDGWAGLTG